MTGTIEGAAGVITGAGRGVGAAIARELAGQGAHLALGDLADTDLRGVVSEVRARGGRAVAVKADVRSFDDMLALHDACMAEFGRIDFAVANAGVDEASSMSDGDPARWRILLETNVLGVAHTIRAVLPSMQRQGAGHIILIASLSGRETYVGQPMYIASKWAVVGLGRALRKEVLPFGVRVTLIEPGPINTRMLRDNPRFSEHPETVAPLEPEDVARACVYALTQPRNVSISELVIDSRERSSSW